MNKYLEKIAGWKEIEPGVVYDWQRQQLGTTAEGSKRLQKEYDSRHRAKGAGLTAIAGGALALGAGLSSPKQALKHPGRLAKITGVMAGAGAIGGYALGHIGAKQTPREVKIDNGMNRALNKYHERLLKQADSISASEISSDDWKKLEADPKLKEKVLDEGGYHGPATSYPADGIKNTNANEFLDCRNVYQATTGGWV
jgi:hypothetical protein